MMVLEEQTVVLPNMLALSGTVDTPEELESAVSSGLPKRALERLSQRLFTDRRAASEYKFTIVPQATWKRRKEKLSPEESEKVERIARVLVMAEYIFDDPDQAREWMHKPHAELEGRSPLQTARTELGARRVETILNKIFFGLPV